MQPYGGLGMWVWQAGAVHADSYCAQLSSLGFRWVAVKTHDGGSAFNTLAPIEQWRAACSKHHLSFGVWGYLTGDPATDSSMAIQSVKVYKAEFYIADAEIEYERAKAPVSMQFCDAFQKQLPHLPRVLSSFGRIDLHSIAWGEWAKSGFDFMPQAYACESSALTPRACLAAAEKVWPRDRIYPTLGAYKGTLGTLSGGQLYESVKDLRVPGVNVWDAQECSHVQLAGLARWKPTPLAPHPPERKPSWDGKTPFRTLRLTSPVMRGPDVKKLEQACNDRLDWRGVKPIVPAGMYTAAVERRCKLAAFDLGLLSYDGTVVTQKLIEQPWTRTPAEVARDKQRRHKIVSAQQQHGKGLAALPVIAAHYLNVHEDPAGSNRGHPHPSDWEETQGIDGEPWCACFASAMVVLGGGHIAETYCPTIEAHAKAKSNGFDAWTTNPHEAGPGWLTLYDWSGNKAFADHVGIVESIGATSHTAIEGNTGGTNPAWGGMVAREVRDFSLVVGYARPHMP